MALRERELSAEAFTEAIRWSGPAVLLAVPDEERARYEHQHQRITYAPLSGAARYGAVSGSGDQVYQQ